jgi:hypothetical protein
MWSGAVQEGKRGIAPAGPAGCGTHRSGNIETVNSAPNDAATCVATAAGDTVAAKAVAPSQMSRSHKDPPRAATRAAVSVSVDSNRGREGDGRTTRTKRIPDDSSPDYQVGRHVRVRASGQAAQSDGWISWSGRSPLRQAFPVVPVHLSHLCRQLDDSLLVRVCRNIQAVVVS